MTILSSKTAAILGGRCSKAVTVFGAAFLLFFTACAPELVPFSQKIMDEAKISDSDLKRVQFYLSEDVVLGRQITEGSGGVESGGRLRIERGKRIEEVVIRRGTPGVLLFKPDGKPNHFAIGFDDKSDKRFLMFGPNPKQGGQFVLLATRWEGKNGEIRYDDRTFFVQGDAAAFARLMVDLRKINKTEISSSRAKGRRVE